LISLHATCRFLGHVPALPEVAKQRRHGRVIFPAEKGGQSGCGKGGMTEKQHMAAILKLPCSKRSACMSPNSHLTISPQKDANYSWLPGVEQDSLARESSNSQTGAPLIVAIDDSPTVRRIIEALCQRQQLRVRTFSSGVSAISAWEQGDLPVPDLILLDIEMPGPNGYTLTRWCGSQPALQNVPIILLSGHQDRWHMLRGRFAGADDYLSKPFQSNQLVQMLIDKLARVRPDWHVSERSTH
jgi:CheY-like chemotaxis protein